MPFQKSAGFQILIEKHPVKQRLIEALMIRAERFLLSQLERIWLESTGQKPEHSTEELHDLQQSVAEMKELGTWTVGPLLPLSEDQLERELRYHADAAEAVGVSHIKIARHLQEVEKLARRKGRGRPVKRRPLAVTALEMKLANPQISWTRLARLMCRCKQEEREKAGHEFRCREALRQEVLALKKVLKKYKIAV